MTDVHTSLPPALRRALDLHRSAGRPRREQGLSRSARRRGRRGRGRRGTPARSRRPGRRRSGRCSTTTPRRCRAAGSAPGSCRWVAADPRGGVALDVGSGLGNVTASLARAAGPDGLALGVDISEPMLARAVRNEAGPQVGFIKADAQRLPLRDNTVDAAVSTAVLQLVPKPQAALVEIARVLRPGGRLAVMVPTAGRLARYWRLLPNVGRMRSTTTRSVTSWRRTDSPAFGSRTSAPSSGCAPS